MATFNRIAPCLWFDTEAEQAAEFYTKVFDNSRITATTHYLEGGPRPAGMVLTVEFEVDGQPFTALNGGPEFHFSESISFQVFCRDQAEVDRYWDALTENGEEGPCGWCKDRFGVSWQVVPVDWVEMFKDPDQAKAQRAFQAMMGMKKLDIAALHRAFEGG